MIRSRAHTLTMTLFLSLLASCASNGPEYKQASAPGKPGYVETMLTDQRYRVTYVAKAPDHQQAADLALLRAAELTLQKGYSWFEVASREGHVTEDTRHLPRHEMGITQQTTTQCGLLGCSSSTRPVHSVTIGTETRRVKDNAVATIELVMGRGEMPEGARYYPAATLADSLRSKYL